MGWPTNSIKRLVSSCDVSHEKKKKKKIIQNKNNGGREEKKKLSSKTKFFVQTRIIVFRKTSFIVRGNCYNGKTFRMCQSDRFREDESRHDNRGMGKSCIARITKVPISYWWNGFCDLRIPGMSRATTYVKDRGESVLSWKCFHSDQLALISWTDDRWSQSI